MSCHPFLEGDGGLLVLLEVPCFALGIMASSRSKTKTTPTKTGSAAGHGGGLRGETLLDGVSGEGADNAAAHSPRRARWRM